MCVAMFQAWSGVTPTDDAAASGNEDNLNQEMERIMKMFDHDSVTDQEGQQEHELGIESEEVDDDEDDESLEELEDEQLEGSSHDLWKAIQADEESQQQEGHQHIDLQFDDDSHPHKAEDQKQQ